VPSLVPSGSGVRPRCRPGGCVASGGIDLALVSWGTTLTWRLCRPRRRRPGSCVVGCGADLAVVSSVTTLTWRLRPRVRRWPGGYVASGGIDPAFCVVRSVWAQPCWEW